MEKTLTLLALLTLLCPIGSAQDILEVECYYNTKGGINGLYVADVNGDGAKEIIAGSYDGFVYLFDESCTKLWEYYAKCPVYSAWGVKIKDDNRTYALGGNCQHVALINPNGEDVWKYHTGSQVQRIRTGDVNGDGLEDIITASETVSGSSSSLNVINASGDTLWADTFKGAPMHAVEALDLNNDGSDEVIAGTSSITAYSSSGDTLWSMKVNGNVEAITHADINGDGAQEILVGARPTLYVLNPQGGIIWSFDGGGQIEDVYTYDLNSDGKKEVLAASDKLYALDNAGTVMWSYNTGNQIHKVTAHDLDSDGSVEVIAGSDIIYVIGQEGILLWKYRTYRDVTGLIVDAGEKTRLIASALDRNVYVFKASQKMPYNVTVPFVTTTSIMQETTSTIATIVTGTTLTNYSTTTHTIRMPFSKTTTTTPYETSTTQEIQTEEGVGNLLLIMLTIIILLVVIYYVSNKIRGLS
ncbi:MAG: VCBS repeat-containing protein [Candidatus Altiarchaeota archaeon]|nr:VCBS repeat-containing protein [Candidatus Altiarchaeota archaeon]